MGHVYKKISELGEVITGKTPSTKREEFFNGEFPFITPSDIPTFHEKYLLNTERTISKLGKKVLKGKLLPRDTICFVCIGSTIGKMCKTNMPSFTNQQINALIPNSSYDSDYLFYYLRYLKNYFIQVGAGSGSGKGIVNKTVFSKTKLSVEEDKGIQLKVSNVLNKYDNLIEVNYKQINILEIIAQRVYVEWFIKFKFPGFEKVEFQSQDPRGWVLSTTENMHKIPCGWKFDELINIAEFRRGKNITSSEMIEGGIPVISAGLLPSGYHNEANVFGKNLTISASGANAGYLSYHLSDVWAADCSYYQDDKNIWFVYNALKFLQPVISNMQVGSAQPHVYAKNINKLSTIIPPDELIELYCEKVDPIYEQIRILNLTNENLIKQRDALLPRLMSGRLNLEGKEIV